MKRAADPGCLRCPRNRWRGDRGGAAVGARRELERLAAVRHPCIQLVEQTADVDLAEQWLRLLPSIEGVVAKRADRHYAPAGAGLDQGQAVPNGRLRRHRHRRGLGRAKARARTPTRRQPQPPPGCDSPDRGITDWTSRVNPRSGRPRGARDPFALATRCGAALATRSHRCSSVKYVRPHWTPADGSVSRQPSCAGDPTGRLRTATWISFARSKLGRSARRFRSIRWSGSRSSPFFRQVRVIRLIVIATSPAARASDTVAAPLSFRALVGQPRGHLRARPEAELAQDVLDVHFDGPCGNDECVGDLAIARPAATNRAISRSRAGQTRETPPLELLHERAESEVREDGSPRSSPVASAYPSTRESRDVEMLELPRNRSPPSTSSSARRRCVRASSGRKRILPAVSSACA